MPNKRSKKADVPEVEHTAPESSAPRLAVARRFKRIEGQVKGLSRMLESDRFCVDILHQIQAAKAALTKAETELLRVYARECVDDALQEEDIDKQREIIVELVSLFERTR